MLRIIEIDRCLNLHNAAVEPAAQELKITSHEGHRFLAYTVVPIMTEQGQRSGAVMVIRDITEHKAFDQMRTEFVMRASHEWRTPVTSIRMGIGMLSEKALFQADSREQELFDTIAEEINRLMRLVNDLFDLSRLQASRLPLELAPHALDDVLEAARQRFQLNMEEQQITLTVDVQENLPQVLIDLSHFERVLDNLLNNAQRHTPRGGSISLSASRLGDWLRIAIADTGSGIDRAQQRRVFEPFVQAFD